MLVVFIGFLAMGMALPVVPRHVHDTLGQGTVVVGVVMGAQFIASFGARLWGGALSDSRGPRPVALAGLLAACGVGAGYLASLQFADQPHVAVAMLIGSRLLVGVAEGFIVTAILAWAIGHLGPAHAGKVIGWIGVALFGAYGIGAQLGVALQASFGFAGVGVATALVPMLALLVAFFIPGLAPGTAKRTPFHRVVGAIRLPGLGLMCCGAGFAMINTFVALLFTQRGWGTGALGITCMGAGFIVARLLLGHLPDKLGGARVALFCVMAEAVGLVLIWGATGPEIAGLGAMLTGGGYAIGFQGFGVEAVKRAPPESRGSAMGAYVAFQDICMGMAAPLGGLLAAAAGIATVYLAAAAAALVAAALAFMMARPSSSIS